MHNVLLIEDNPGDARLIREMIAEDPRAPFTVHYADRLAAGLTHLAAALGVPTVGLYVATRPELTGLHAPIAKNLSGGSGGPTVDAVMQALFPPEPQA